MARMNNVWKHIQKNRGKHSEWRETLHGKIIIEQYEWRGNALQGEKLPMQGIVKLSMVMNSYLFITGHNYLSEFYYHPPFLLS